MRARTSAQRGAGLVELHRVVLGRLVAVPLVGHDVDQGHPAGNDLGLFQRLLKLLLVVAVHRPKVMEAHLRPHDRGQNEPVETIAKAPDQPVDRLTRRHPP